MADRFAGLGRQWPLLLNEAAYYEIALDELETKHRKLSEEAFAGGDARSARLHEEASRLYRDAQPFGDVDATYPAELQEHVLSAVERLLNDVRTAEELKAALDELHEKIEHAER